LLEETEMKIILASESPFRKRALDLIGLPYETRPSRIDEKAIRDDNPAELTRKTRGSQSPQDRRRVSECSCCFRGRRRR